MHHNIIVLPLVASLYTKRFGFAGNISSYFDSRALVEFYLMIFICYTP